MGECLAEVRARGSAAGDGDLFAVNGGDGSLPAGQGFFEVELDGGEEVVAVASECGVLFLRIGVSIKRPDTFEDYGGVRERTSVIMKCKSWVPPSS